MHIGDACLGSLDLIWSFFGSRFRTLHNHRPQYHLRANGGLLLCRNRTLDNAQTEPDPLHYCISHLTLPRVLTCWRLGATLATALLYLLHQLPHSSMSVSFKQKPTRIPHSRKKSGCLPCRRRRKKCDEEKPICSGCTRNHLICSWPPDVACQSDEAEVAFLGAEDVLRVSSEACEDVSAPESTGNLLTIAPSPLPAVFRNGSTSQLLEYFRDITAPRMIGGTHFENPFITYNIRISTHCTSLQHAILAVGSCHLAYSDPTFIVPSREHYAVAVRNLKLGITRWRTSSMIERMALLAASLTLCWYEVSFDAEGKTSGQFYLQFFTGNRCEHRGLIVSSPSC